MNNTEKIYNLEQRIKTLETRKIHLQLKTGKDFEKHIFRLKERKKDLEQEFK